MNMPHMAEPQPTPVSPDQLFQQAQQLYTQGQIKECFEQLKQISQSHPGYWPSLQLAIKILRQVDQEKDAITMLQRARPHFSGSQLIDLEVELAGSLLATGHVEQADATLKALVSQYTASMGRAFGQLALIQRARGEAPEAIQNFRRASELSEKPAKMMNLLAETFSKRSDTENAIIWFERALENAPDDYAIRFNYVFLLETANRLDAAREQLDILMQQRSDYIPAQILHGRLLRREKREEEALEHLKRIEPKCQTEEERKNLYFELGRLNDKLGHYGDAMASYEQANCAALALKPSDIPREKLKENFDTVFAQLNDESAKALNALQDDKPEQAPVFAFGFPRSGTTLTHQFLDAHSQLQVLEEKPYLMKTYEHMMSDETMAQNAFAQINPAVRTKMRDAYLRSLAHNHTQEKDFYVDKLPLNFLRVHFMKYLFPQAKMIFIKRHPCDAILSCFMQDFALNLAMEHFTDLEHSVKLYCMSMQWWQRASQMLELDLHYLCYEELTSAPEETIKSTIEFLGLPWEPEVLNYRDKLTTSKQKISTPSYHQVSQPIYKTSQNRWKHYAKYFEPYMDDLRPHIEWLGYDTD